MRNSVHRTCYVSQPLNLLLVLVMDASSGGLRIQFCAQDGMRLTMVVCAPGCCSTAVQLCVTSSSSQGDGSLFYCELPAEVPVVACSYTAVHHRARPRSRAFILQGLAIPTPWSVALSDPYAVVGS